MPRFPRRFSRAILLALALAAILGMGAIVPAGADLGALINRAAAWASPPRDNIRTGTGGRYRKAEEAAADFVGPPAPPWAYGRRPVMDVGGPAGP